MDSQTHPPNGERQTAHRTPDAEHRCLLLFDPEEIEGTWAQKYPGGMIGYTSCLAAGLARELMCATRGPDVARGIRGGLVAMRQLHREGYGRPAPEDRCIDLAFPSRRIAERLSQESQAFPAATVQDPVRFLSSPPVEERPPEEPGFWTLLEDRRCSLGQLAEEIVLVGEEAALDEVPIGRFGALVTADRREVESFRSIRNLMMQYLRRPAPQPLSIAVFGPPGAGKSFGVTQVARSVRPDEIETRTFNLSQVASSEELLDALHQVRDVGLSGKIPLVFWDEFDSPLQGKPLGWLRYFLAPMQDGSFQQGQITHPIGRAIFVFAGGTCARMKEFEQAANQAREAKGPDFVSRLKGFVNIMGPDPQPVPGGDPHHIVRRAILLRSILKRNVPDLLQRDNGRDRLQVDRGVLRAFLYAPRYRHGARSIESIVAMSLLGGKSQFERSALPAQAQLDLHVNGQQFLALVQQIEVDGDLLEALADAAHEVFCRGLAAEGFQRGERDDAQAGTHPLLKQYAELAESEKEENRANVRDIVRKVALAGYAVIPARSDEPPFDFPGEDLERLAELEHERWVVNRIASGWRFGPERDDARKIHPALLPWQALSEAERARFHPEDPEVIGLEALPEAEREKDRTMIRGIPRILAQAGYTIVKVGEQR